MSIGATRGECQACPAYAARCAHWGPYVVRLYAPVRGEASLNRWGVEGPGLIDEARARREGLPVTSMFLLDEAGYSGRHEDQTHALLDFEARAQAMRRYETPSAPRSQGG